MEQNKNYVFSAVLPTGEIVEAIYDMEEQVTKLAVWIGDQVNVVEDGYEILGKKYWPFPANYDLLKNGFVKLPSGVTPYEGITSLFQQTKDFIARYVKLPEKFLTIASIYVLLTWVYDRFQTLPYLRVLGEYGSGKTRFQQTIGSLCYKGMLAGSSITMAALFRTIDQIQGTLVYDEADQKSSEMWDEKIKILNSGHTANVPVLRMNVKKDGQMSTQAFKVFGPKVLASRERFSDEALESRCLTQHLFSMKSTKIPIHLPNDFEQQATNLRNKLLAFRLDSFHKIVADESTVDGIEFPRLRQSALAVTTLASMIGKDVLSEVMSYLKGYERELQTSRKRDPKVDVLLAILTLVKKNLDENCDKIHILDIKLQFERINSDDYLDDAYQYKDENKTVYVHPKRSASPKKIGVHVRNLGIQTERDNHGFFIPIGQEFNTIDVLADQYGLDKPWTKDDGQKELPLNPMSTDISTDDIPF